jgi:hypothetical protein
LDRKGEVLPKQDPAFSRWLGIAQADSRLNFTFGGPTAAHFLSGM